MRLILSRLQRFLSDRKGVAAIEFAMIAPTLILLYFGTVDLANWYITHRRLVVAGSSMADLTTQSPGQVTKAELAQFWTGVGQIIAPLPLSDVRMTLRSFRKNGSSVQQQWTYSASNGTCGSAPNVAALTAMGANEMTDGNDILVAAVCSTATPMGLRIFGFTSFPMQYQISMRPRTPKTLDCPTC
jgi:Flp pilus assembly protein TadG